MNSKTMACLILLLALILPGTAQATTITYEVKNMEDTTEGEDLWQYTYHFSSDISDTPFDMGDAIAIVFDRDLYGIIEPDPSQPSDDWIVVPYQDPLNPVGGFLWVQALADNLTPDFNFTIDFIWLGEDTTPGSQNWDRNDLTDAENGYVITESGTTAPVPEPATGLLILSGLAFWANKRRRNTPVSCPV